MYREIICYMFIYMFKCGRRTDETTIGVLMPHQTRLEELILAPSFISIEASDHLCTHSNIYGKVRSMNHNQRALKADRFLVAEERFQG